MLFAAMVWVPVIVIFTVMFAAMYAVQRVRGQAEPGDAVITAKFWSSLVGFALLVMVSTVLLSWLVDLEFYRELVMKALG